MISNKFIGLNKAIELGFEFVADNPSIVTSISKLSLYNDEPKLYQYSSYLKDSYGLVKDTNELTASGISFKKKNAIIKLLGEAMERYSLTTNNNGNLIYKDYNELNSAGKLSLNPQNIIQLDREMLSHNILSTKLHWLEGKSLMSDNKILVPAQLIYVPYMHANTEPYLQIPISTGAAAGTSLESAIYRGICEVIERDSFMIHYLNKIHSPLIDLKDLAKKARDLNRIMTILNRYKLELFILDITTDLGMPSFAAIILDKTGLGPAVSVGLKSGLDIKQDIIGAIEESLMTRSWIRDKFVYLEPSYKREKIIRTIEDRAHFWFSLDSIKYLDFWLKNNNVKKINIKTFKRSENELRNTIKLLKDKKIEVIYVDITDKKIKKYNFVVVKVIIPQLQPLYLDERYPYLEGIRLYDAPVKMGVLKKLKTEHQLNKIPHPFL